MPGLDSCMKMITLGAMWRVDNKGGRRGQDTNGKNTIILARTDESLN